ncbi:MAG TPA: PIN domain-containing protein [Nitratidesulfovibrio sp.]|nr:PIN domain-containing protein [Nitratidesulfovibrio sp.]
MRLIGELGDIAFGALAVDTNIFYDLNFDFDSGGLGRLKRFAGSTIQYVMPDIFVFEVKKKFCEKMEESRGELRRSIKRLHKHIDIDDVVKGSIIALTKHDAFVKTLHSIVDRYVDNCGMVVLDSSSLMVSDIFSRYFNSNPPFEKKKDKKSEFPDAFAIASLSKWGVDNGVNVLVVTKDKGCTNYIESMERVWAVNDIDTALSVLSSQNGAREYASRFEEFLSVDEGVEFLEGVEQEIISKIENESVEIEAYSYVDVEVSGYVSGVNGVTFTSIGYNGSRFIVTEIAEDYVECVMRASVDVEITYELDFSVWDSIDKESITLSGRSGTTNIVLEVEVEVIFHGETIDGSFEFDNEYSYDIGGVDIEVSVGDVLPYEDDDRYEDL